MSAQNHKIFQKDLKNLFFKSAESSTAHGFPNIIKNEQLPIKFVWIFFTLISTGLCSYMVSKSILDYLNHDVVTKIRIENEVPIEFPTITICNLNPFYKNKTFDFYKQYFGENFTSFEQLDEEDYRIGVFNVMNEIKNPIFTDEQRKLVGPSIEKMLVRCEIMEMKCTADDFSWFYIMDFGNCFRFNSGFELSGKRTKIKKVNKAGTWSAFKVDLFLENSNDLIGLSNSNGIRVYVDNSTDFPTSYSDGIDLMPGTSANVIIKKHFSEKLPKPYSDCDLVSGSTHDSELYKSIIARNKTYKQKDCMFLCLQKDIMKNCQCYDLWYDQIDTETKPCLNETDIGCANFRYYLYFQEGKKLNYKDECPLECSSLSYELFSTVSEYPTKSYLSYLKKNALIKDRFLNSNIQDITLEQIKERIVNINLYFNDLAYTKITESEKTTLVNLLANLGGKFCLFSAYIRNNYYSLTLYYIFKGTLGLFLGISILSFVEIIEFFIKIAFLIKDHLTTKNNKQSKVFVLKENH